MSYKVSLIVEKRGWMWEGDLIVNVCIHDFDDVKEESNKAASNDKHLLQDCFNKQNLVSWFTKDQALP